MKFVGLIMAFSVIIVLIFLSIGFISTQSTPDNSTVAGQQFENQSKVVELSYAGINGGILLLILAFVLSAVWLIIKVVS